MNERIKLLAEQAGFIDRGTNHTAYMNFDHEKFAELIVKECGVALSGPPVPSNPSSWAIILRVLILLSALCASN